MLYIIPGDDRREFYIEGRDAVTEWPVACEDPNNFWLCTFYEGTPMHMSIGKHGYRVLVPFMSARATPPMPYTCFDHEVDFRRFLGDTLYL